MSDNNSNFGAFAVGLFTGALLGGIAALLFAPQSGEETRQLIQEKSQDAYEKAGKTMEETYAQAEASIAEARAKIEELAAEAKKKSAELQEKGQIMLENITHKENVTSMAAAIENLEDELDDVEEAIEEE
ncbi:MAG: YtxH domain-containing protein [Anaerolineaceae bacterium]|nr:YtxH domain-containing protein [Anaerolineaceae bacterium]